MAKLAKLTFEPLLLFYLLSLQCISQAANVPENELLDGFSAADVFESKSGNCVGFTYDDVIVLPGMIMIKPQQTFQPLW